MTYEVEKNAKEWAEKIPAEAKAKLDAAVERARKALRGDDMGEIRSAQEELTRVFQEAGQAFYQQQQPQSPPAGDAGGTPGAETAGAGAAAGARDDVVEADYEIVDDDKK
jgi:molecular chaperone DnaK